MLGEVLTTPQRKNRLCYEIWTLWYDISIGEVIYLEEVGCGGMDWIELAQDRDMCQALVNAVMNLRVP